MLIAVGCGKTETERLEDSVVGSYEAKFAEDSVKLVLLENGTIELYENGVKRDEGPLKIVVEEVHADFKISTKVFRIEQNGDLTFIARIKDGKRTPQSKEYQTTWKKLK